MLVLTRKLMEKLYIGDAICITVVRLESNQVRLGIEAPRAIPVVRAELLGRRDEPTALGASAAVATPPESPEAGSPTAPGSNGPRPRAKARMNVGLPRRGRPATG